jgi:molybdopterin-guanine dinucleotide biosynthesis protein A
VSRPSEVIATPGSTIEWVRGEGGHSVAVGDRPEAGEWAGHGDAGSVSEHAVTADGACRYLSSDKLYSRAGRKRRRLSHVCRRLRGARRRARVLPGWNATLGGVSVRDAVNRAQYRLRSYSEGRHAARSATPRSVDGPGVGRTAVRRSGLLHTRGESPAVTGAVPAGGNGRPFDAGDKPLATPDGETFVPRGPGALRASTVQSPLAAVRPETRREHLRRGLPPSRDGRFVCDDSSRTGPLAGLLSACETASTPWLFAVGCGLPPLDSKPTGELSTRVPQSPARAPSAVPPVAQPGRREPLNPGTRRSATIDCRRGLSTGCGSHAPRTALDDVEYVGVSELPQVARPSTTESTPGSCATVRSCPFRPSASPRRWLR